MSLVNTIILIVCELLRVCRWDPWSWFLMAQGTLSEIFCFCCFFCSSSFGCNTCWLVVVISPWVLVHIWRIDMGITCWYAASSYQTWLRQLMNQMRLFLCFKLIPFWIFPQLVSFPDNFIKFLMQIFIRIRNMTVECLNLLFQLNLKLCLSLLVLTQTHISCSKSASVIFNIFQ